MGKVVSVIDVLKNFMLAMTDWEVAFRDEQMLLINADKDTSDCDQKYEGKLREILARFSVANERSWARLIDLGCGSPPTYDPERDVINSPVQEAKGCSVIVEQKARLRATYRFIFKSSKEGWLIVRKETKNGEKWKKTAL